VSRRDLAETPMAFVAVLVAVPTGFPLVWMFYSSLKSSREIFASPWSIPSEFLWENFARAWTVGRVGLFGYNSLLVTGGTIFLVLLLASLAAFAFARLSFPGKELPWMMMLAGLAVPSQTAVVPLYQVVKTLGLLNTRTGLVLCYSAWSLPLAIVILRAFFRTVPKNLEDAARLDGCSSFGIFRRVFLPLTTPALGTVAIITGLGAWNEFLLALLFIRDQGLKTLPLGMYFFQGTHTTDYPLVFSALTIASIPMILLFAVGQKHVIGGLTAGAIKQ